MTKIYDEVAKRNRKCMILKAVLLLRKTNRYQSKEDQIAEVEKYLLTDEEIKMWIEDLKDTRPEWMKQGFESEDAYFDDMARRDWEFEQEYAGGYYTPSATNRDYGPSNPWDAPGMSVRDFI